MNVLINFLLLLNVVFSVFFLLKSTITKSGITINHVTTFSIGFIYYWVVPMLLGRFEVVEKLEIPLSAHWQAIFNQIPQQALCFFLLFSLLFYFSFVFGGLTRGGNTRPINKIEYISYYPDKVFLNFILILCIPFLIYFVYKFKDALFRGYTVLDWSSSGEKGSFVGLSSLILSVAFIFTINSEHRVHYLRVPFTKLIFNKFVIFYFVVGLLILSLGGRLYFVSGVLMFLIYKSNYFSRFKAMPFMIFGIFAILIIGGLGIIRSASTVTLNAIFSNILAEPVLNTFSLIAFLQANILELINFPKFLLSDLITLVPSGLMPMKGELVLNPIDFGYTIYSPVGAMNSFPSLMINFGFIGSLLFSACLSFFLNYLKQYNNSLFCKTVYIMISGWLAFTFFRDPFSISIVKNILEFSILLPSILVFCLMFICKTFALDTKYEVKRGILEIKS